MDNDFASKLQSVLSNPEAMSKITSIASSLGVDNGQSAAPDSSEPRETLAPTPQPSAPLQGLFAPSDPRIALLNSVKPLLREEKRGRVDSLLNALTVASMLKNFKK